MNDTDEESEEEQEDDDEDEEDIEQCLLCDKPGDAGTDGTFYGCRGGTAIFVHTHCNAEWRQRVLTNLTNKPMIPQLKPVQRGTSHGRVKEQRSEDYAPNLDQAAGAAARRIIKEAGIEDTTEHWRAVKKAYLAGYADARR